MTRREHWCAPYHRPSRLVGGDGASDTEFGCATVDLVPETALGSQSGSAHAKSATTRQDPGREAYSSLAR